MVNIGNFGPLSKLLTGKIEKPFLRETARMCLSWVGKCLNWMVKRPLSLAPLVGVDN